MEIMIEAGVGKVRSRTSFRIFGREISYRELCQRGQSPFDIDPVQYVTLLWDEA